MENLRYMLYQYNTKTSLFIGTRLAFVNAENVEDGYMAGAGQIFSKKALTKFNEISLKNETFCPPNDTWMDDVMMGKLLVI